MSEQQTILYIDDEIPVLAKAQQLLGKYFEVVTINNLPALGMKLAEEVFTQRKKIFAVLTDQNFGSAFSGTSIGERLHHVNKRLFDAIPFIVVSKGLSKTAKTVYEASPYFAGEIEKEKELPPENIENRLRTLVDSWKNQAKKSVASPQRSQGTHTRAFGRIPSSQFPQSPRSF